MRHMTIALGTWLAAATLAAAAEPVGWLDRIDARGVVQGWAADVDSPGASIWVHVYVERDDGRDRRFAGAVLANRPRPDVEHAGYPGDHGFQHQLPAWALDGQRRRVRVYGIDPQKQRNAELRRSPTPYTIAAPPTPTRSVQLLGDPQLNRGLYVLKPSPQNATDYSRNGAGVPVVFRYPGTAGTPAWKVAQHHMRTDLARVPGRWMSEDRYAWADAEKRFALAGGGTCELAVNSKTSYQNRFRNPTDPNYRKDWPHLYVSQSIAQRAETRLSAMRALNLRFQLRLRYANHDTGPGYNPAWHTGHFVMFLTVRDTQAKDYLWYGCNLYDARGGSRYYQASEKFDGDGTDNSTGKLIRQVARSSLTTTPVESGEWVTVSGDLLPDIRSAIQRNLQNGNLRGRLENFEVGSFLIGWEVPGLFVGTMQARGLSLQAVVDQ